MAVAKEAALTARVLGNEVVELYDVGVAGLHRLLAHSKELMSAKVVIAIAGMEGALASVIGGLVNVRLPKHLHGAVEEIVMGWWHRPLLPMEGMGELVKELKEQGYKIYLLSNASVDLRKYFHRIPGSEYFDGLMVSAEEKRIKPQHEIFHTLYSRFHLNPEQCIFIDDSPANIEAALCTGMDGIIFRGSAERLRRELREKGVNVKETIE